MQLFLGVDGGGTGCRAAIADAAGRILGQGSAGPANIASDPAGAVASILTAITEALAAAVGTAQVTDILPTLRAGLGLAGANAAGTVTRLRAALPFRSLRVTTDAVAAVKGALGERDGILAALGTGSVFARQEARAIHQIGGWGLALGDEGSGAWLGRSLLAASLAAHDGFRPLTPLLRQVLADHGGAEGVIGFAVSARPIDFAGLVPWILASDDPAAAALLAKADAAIVAAIGVLQPPGAPLPVTFIGGLGQTFAARLAGRWAFHAAAGSALDGALRLAREAD
ncbi:MAG: ATPase [Rhodobacterales bacterium 32-66-7]|nr:MAG: ATPase [Rhodobacterales bacterium 32-66-7]